jgi:hypothetical protein
MNALERSNTKTQWDFFGNHNFSPRKHYRNILWIILSIHSLNTFADLQFPNPSLEEDVANVGYPDGWIIPKTTNVTMVRDKVSDGGKAARFDKGYILLSCNMREKKLPELKFNITFDAMGKDKAQLGVIIGCYRKVQGKTVWINSRYIWNRNLKNSYTKIKISGMLPKNAVRELVWFAVYRSNRKGVVWLDNFKINSSHGKKMSAAQRKQLNILKRDWTYMASRVNQALAIKKLNDTLLKAKKETDAILNRIELDDIEVLKEALNSKGTDTLVKINQALAGNANDIAYLNDAYQREKPDAIIPERLITSTEIISLGNEYQAFGLSVANIQNKERSIPISISGGEKLFDKIDVRRQVFMTNWYQKGHVLIADPLTLLPYENKQWNLAIGAGKIVKLYVSFKVRAGLSGDFPLKITAGASRLEVTVKVKPMNLPDKPFFANFQCIYPGNLPAGKHPELAARDLAEHYTTAIEFPFLPKIIFNPDGTISSEDFKNDDHAKWMLAYSKENIKLALFWIHSQFPTANSKIKIPYVDKKNKLLPVWKKAYTNLLCDWLRFAEKEGVGKENFLVWCKDELHSGKEFATAPGSKVRIGVETYKLTKKIAPDVKRMITAGNYSLPKDVAAFTPYVDIILPAWPLPTKLVKWAPADLNPRKEFFERTLPMLKSERSKRGLKIWSYKVDSGKTEHVLNNRSYPICAVGIGYTGVGSWAYNCSSGKTWDDTDGRILDYSFVYNGEESHPLNAKYNITKEIIVPSIRWEAMRMGIQDAKILLYLKTNMEKGEYDDATSTEIQKILKQAEDYGRNLTYSFKGINEISSRIRELASAPRIQK